VRNGFEPGVPDGESVLKRRGRRIRAESRRAVSEVNTTLFRKQLYMSVRQVGSSALNLTRTISPSYFAHLGCRLRIEGRKNA